MKIDVVGGGPAGLYFAILAKKRDASRRIRVLERNRASDTFGFGVVFSDATMDNIARADSATVEAMRKAFAHWDDIDVYYGGEVVTSRGHGFAGLSRKAMLEILEKRAAELGVELSFSSDVTSLDAHRDADLVVAADGVNSSTRRWLADELEPQVENRPNRFVWLGTTFPFSAFTFYFKQNPHGLFRVHAYRYAPEQSTFIVECTDETFRKSGLAVDDEDRTVAYLEALFAHELKGHRLLKNRSLWRQFPIVRCDRWHAGKVVLLGDAVHTAHFSIGSGTKLALEDAIALDEQLDGKRTTEEALVAYETSRRPVVESLQRAAQTSLEWFEHTERYFGRQPPIQFAFNLLTRSLRVTHDNLRARDPEFVRRVDTWFSGGAPTPPMFTPFRLRGMELSNRVVVSPMCQYSAKDGTVDDWHLVHLGSRAIGGAGLVIAEMTDVDPDGRITDGCAGIWKDAHIAAWRRVVDFVHQHSFAKIGVQLAHAGRKSKRARPWHGDRALEDDRWQVVGPSEIPFGPGYETPKALTHSELARIRDEFVAATVRADRAGFDMIELHGAHGYLLASFLSPLSNRRSDEYGGAIEGRLRFPLEVFDAVRAAWPSDKPIFVRISASDWAEGGLSGDESVAVARAFKAHGADLLDVSTGGTVLEARPAIGRLYQTPFSDRIRAEAEIPTMTVGLVTSFTDVNSILAAGRADLCALARAHLFDPYWTRHAAAEQGVQLPWPPQYLAVSKYAPRLR